MKSILVYAFKSREAILSTLCRGHLYQVNKTWFFFLRFIGVFFLPLLSSMVFSLLVHNWSIQLYTECSMRGIVYCRSTATHTDKQTHTHTHTGNKFLLVSSVPFAPISVVVTTVQKRSNHRRLEIRYIAHVSMFIHSCARLFLLTAATFPSYNAFWWTYSDMILSVQQRKISQ